MKQAKEGEFRSKVYTDRPAYADFDAPAKFQAIESIIAKRLKQHPKAICSYSGGSDSDIMIDLIERVRRNFNFPPVKYVFFNTGLEMEATKRHVRETAEKYGVEIETVRPKMNVVLAARKYGIPLISKQFSSRLENVQRNGVPAEVADEFEQSGNKTEKFAELKERYPHSINALSFLCSCDKNGKRQCSQSTINSSAYFLEFIKENPIPFKVSANCCEQCKLIPAKKEEQGFDLTMTGEQRVKGGTIAQAEMFKSAGDIRIMKDGQIRLRPLYYVTDEDKEWYKAHHDIRYSDAYEVYGFKRTSCCMCPISASAVEQLETLKKYEPNLYKAAWNVFGESYRYKQKYDGYRHAIQKKNAAERDVIRQEKREEKKKQDELWLKQMREEAEMRRKMARGECLNCGKQFMQMTVVQKYCSPECGAEYRKTHTFAQLNPVIEFDCACCGRHVQTDGKDDMRTRFCSHSCEKKYWRHPHYEKKGNGTTFQSQWRLEAYERATNK